VRITVATKFGNQATLWLLNLATCNGRPHIVPSRLLMGSVQYRTAILVLAVRYCTSGECQHLHIIH